MKANRRIDATKYRSFSLPSLIRLTALTLLIIHAFFMIDFFLNDIIEMAVFNIFSVLLYTYLTVFTKRYPQRLNYFACFAIFEIVLHAALATLFVGWESGFMMFVVCVTPFPFFLPFKNDTTAFLISGLCGAAFVALKLYTNSGDRVIYADEISQAGINAMYTFNTVLSFLMIIIFSTIYKIKKRLDEVELINKNESLSMLAKIDPLSQLFNRRAMIDFLKTIEKSALAKHETYVIVMGDLDGFKRVNDTYGHSCGDEVIKAVSRIMMQSVPTEGYVCRWGGEELLFAIPNSSEEDGERVAESIRAQLAAQRFSSEGRSYYVTITFGVCQCDGSQSYERGLSVADRRLYYGKEHGKNRVITSRNEEE
ncbi:MAG: GGDEF domain-containing protein [Ruminococcus sp.]|nr:GGDEF domain-containing protein [Ruminococcus sp.]